MSVVEQNKKDEEKPLHFATSSCYLYANLPTQVPFWTPMELNKHEQMKSWRYVKIWKLFLI